MHTEQPGAFGAVLVIIVSAVLTTSCDIPCEVKANCPSLDAGSDTGTPEECIPSYQSPVVSPTCGVFVSSSIGADGADGTIDKPLKTLQEAVYKANGGRVYACAEDFAGSVIIPTWTTIYGGLDCAHGWKYVGATKRSGLVGDPDKPALTVKAGASATSVIDFTIKGANAITAGTSSIAVLVDAAKAEMVRCDLVAGDAMAGTAGASHPMPEVSGTPGENGKPACTADIVSGGGGPTLSCGNGYGSVGGDGGHGKPLNGSDGTNGLIIPQNISTKNAGTGETMANENCKPGTQGDVGMVGKPGAPAPASGDPKDIGTISLDGYTGTIGTEGTKGGPGQGGGGGGGSKGGILCQVITYGGASGGSGGSGGCGGAGGRAGRAGGSSIGLISLNANLAFSSVLIKTGNGGDGGDGGPGQDGGVGPFGHDLAPLPRGMGQRGQGSEGRLRRASGRTSAGPRGARPPTGPAP